jgi:hypothetical protein
MNNQVQAPTLTETDAQALAWRLQTKLPLGWHVESVAHDPPLGLGWHVILRNNQHPYEVRVFEEEDVARFYEVHGAQHPVEFYTDSFILEFHPERVRIELREPREIALADVLELIEWGQHHTAFLTTLSTKRVRCPAPDCGRDDGSLEGERYHGTMLNLWKCWNGHWFTCTYDFEQYHLFAEMPDQDVLSDIPF